MNRALSLSAIVRFDRRADVGLALIESPIGSLIKFDWCGERPKTGSHYEPMSVQYRPPTL